MRYILTTMVVGVFAIALAPAPASGQAMESAEPFAVGTFNIDGYEKVGVVLRDQYVVDLEASNRNLEMGPGIADVPMPENMLELIERYEYGLKYRLYEIVNHIVENDSLSASSRPGFVHEVADVDILAPIRYPGKILNAAGNFYSHTCEGCSPEEQAENDRKIRANRGIPYLFLKPGEGAVIAIASALA